jgi:hypothetical protein
MRATARENWHCENQAHLMTELATLKMLLHLYAARKSAAAPETNGDNTLNVEAAHSDQCPHVTIRPELEPATPFAIDALTNAFGLSAFERAILFLCAGVELDSTLSSLCAAAQGQPARAYPTFSLALAVLPEAHWSALSPEAPLRRWRLIELGVGPALTVAPLRIDECVLHYLTGVSHLDERLAVLVEMLGPKAPTVLAPSHAAVAERVVTAWTASRGQRRMPAIQLCGPDSKDRRAVAAAVAAKLGLHVAALPAHMIPTNSGELDTLARLCEREAVLGATVLLVECDEAGPGQDPLPSRYVARFIERLDAPVMLSERDPRRIAHRDVVRFDVLHPTAPEQRAAWRASLGSAVEADESIIDAITAQFCLALPAICSAAAEAIALNDGKGPEGLAHMAWNLCRSQSRTCLEDLAQRIDPTAGWDDLILPAPQAEAVRRIALHLRHRTTVYDRWGFAAKSLRGLGTSALFAGASGTGKTMAAEVLANELRLDLYRIDLSCVVSKYIGETEKNLRRVFDAAESGGAILLFDEADALFGKRSEVKDSHDRYANIEVSYLLQRMESYRGLAILTTNLKSALDAAFLRRLRFVVQFPFPDAPHRAEIWRRIFPRTTPTEGLDWAKLAKLNVPGGNIRNIAMNAAFYAADENKPVRMHHLLEAARIEYAKLERPLTDYEIGGWS